MLRFLSIINTWLEKQPFLFAIGVNVLLFVLTYTLFVPRFNTVDDVGMLLRVAGVSRVNEATQYILHSNILIGYLMKYLYGLSADVVWYTWHHIIVLFVAYTTLLYTFIRNLSNVVMLGLYVAFFFLVGIFILLNLQFTIVASIVSFAGIMLVLFDRNEYKLSKKEADNDEVVLELNTLSLERLKKTLFQFNYKSLFSIVSLSGIVIMVYGSMVRWMTVQQTIALFIPVIAFLLYKKNYFDVYRKILLLFIGLFISFGLSQYDKRVCYKNEGYKYWHQFRQTYKRIFDYKEIDTLTPKDKETLLAEANWSHNDYLMLQGWGYSDQNLFNIDRGEKASKFLENADRIYYSFSEIKTFMFELLSSRIVMNTLLFIGLIWLFLAFEWRYLLQLMAVVSIVLLLLLYLLYYMKPPTDRTLFQMLFFICVTTLALINNSSYKKAINSPKNNTIFLVFLLLPITFVTQQEYASLSKSNFYKNVWLKKSIEDLNPNKNELYITWGQAIPLEYLSPFSNLDMFDNLVIFHKGVDQITPAALNILKDKGIKNVYKAIANNKNVSLILRNNASNKINLYITYMKEHYNQKLNYPKVVYKNNVYTVYKFNSK